MMIFYKRKITDQILKAKERAQLEGKDIDYIDLSKREWDQLKNELIMGLKIERDLRGTYIKFDGIDIYLMD